MEPSADPPPLVRGRSRPAPAMVCRTRDDGKLGYSLRRRRLPTPKSEGADLEHQRDRDGYGPVVRNGHRDLTVAHERPRRAVGGPADLDATTPRDKGAETEGLYHCLLGGQRPGEMDHRIRKGVAMLAFERGEQSRLQRVRSRQGRAEAFHVDHVDAEQGSKGWRPMRSGKPGWRSGRRNRRSSRGQRTD